jgi:hypothetical protein
MEKEFIMNIKKRILGGFKVAVVLALLCGLATIGLAQEKGSLEQNPAYINIDEAFDFSVTKPTVNIHLPKFLLDNMLSQLDGSPDDPFAETGIDISELTKDIQLLHIVVFETKDPQTMEGAKSGLEKLKNSMSSKWMPIVNVPEGNVTIFAMSDETGSRLAGLAMMVLDKNAVVVGNIVGEIQIGKIIASASKIAAKGGMNLEENDILQKLMGGLNPAPANQGAQPAEPVGQQGSETDPQD